MQVSREQCSGHPVIDHFMCPLCNKLVGHMLIHDGGFQQSFCQRPFCVNCIWEKYMVKEKNLEGPLKKTSVTCPVRGCTQLLQHQMLRAISPLELILYKEIKITCRQCLGGFDPYDYKKHFEKCPKKPINELSFVDQQGPLVASVHSEADLLYQKNILFAGRATPNVVGTATFARFFVSPRMLRFGVCFAKRETEVRVRSDVDFKWLLEAMKNRYNFAVMVDLVHIEVKCFEGDITLDEFLADIPVGALLNVCKRGDLPNNSAKYKFCYTQGINKESCLENKKVFEIEKLEE